MRLAVAQATSSNQRIPRSEPTASGDFMNVRSVAMRRGFSLEWRAVGSGLRITPLECTRLIGRPLATTVPSDRRV